jgi:dihydroorotase
MEITLKAPLDMHLHLRDDDMLKNIAIYSAKDFSGGVIMPNLVPPITTKQQLLDYKSRILKAIDGENFTPYMTLFFKKYSYEFLKSIKNEIVSIKLYPQGATTNSDDGVSSLDIDNLKDTLEAMSELGIILNIHGESDGFVMDREKEFLKTYELLASSFPKLKIIMEHITTKEATKLLDKYDNLYATITLHHLLITLDDVAGGLLKPHLFCKPIAKTTQDRKALLELALNAHPKVMFGSDSAPHPKESKESYGCAAGIFTAPLALIELAQLFDKHNKLENLQKFISDNAVNIYNILPIYKEIRLIKKDYKIPNLYNGVVPFHNNQVCKWSIDKV